MALEIVIRENFCRFFPSQFSENSRRDSDIMYYVVNVMFFLVGFNYFAGEGLPSRNCLRCTSQIWLLVARSNAGVG